MTCPLCGTDTYGGAELCPHHVGADGERAAWSASNRIMCDVIHRGHHPDRLTPEQRDDYASDASDV